MNRSRVAVLALLALLSTAGGWDYPSPGFLTLWTTPRATALAGALTGLDTPSLGSRNPAALVLFPGFAVRAGAGPWLEGFYPELCFSHFAAVLPLEPLTLGRVPVTVGTDVVHMRLWEYDRIDKEGHFLGQFRAWNLAVSVAGAMELSPKLAAGLRLKLAHSTLPVRQDYWFWEPFPYYPSPHLWPYGLEDLGTGTAVAADVGLLYRPWPCLSGGLALTDAGPRIRWQESGETSPLPTALRAGLCWTPLRSPAFTLRALPEITFMLYELNPELYGHGTPGEALEATWLDSWKSFGLEGELSLFGVTATARIAYFEDVATDRGGLVYEKYAGHYREHVSLWGALITPDIGTLTAVGICWGAGVSYKRFTLDFASDAAIYDFDTANWKLGVAWNR